MGRYGVAFNGSVRNLTYENVNSFRSALQADRLVGMILAEAGGGARSAPPAVADKAKGFWARRFG